MQFLKIIFIISIAYFNNSLAGEWIGSGGDTCGAGSISIDFRGHIRTGVCGKSQKIVIKNGAAKYLWYGMTEVSIENNSIQGISIKSGESITCRQKITVLSNGPYFAKKDYECIVYFDDLKTGSIQ